MAQEIYTDLDGTCFALKSLDGDEQKLVEELHGFALQYPDWNRFRNLWMEKVGEFYEARGLSRKETTKTIAYRIAQDLCSRIGIAAGYVRAPDYRDELQEIIDERFQTRREFCDAAGISEDMLSHVLAKRKNLAIDTLAEALDRIGYRIRIVPKESAPMQQRN